MFFLCLFAWGGLQTTEFTLDDPTGNAPAVVVDGVELSTIEANVVNRLNAMRRGGVVVDRNLMWKARVYANYMAATNDYRHSFQCRPDLTPRTPSNLNVGPENIGRGQHSSIKILSDWAGSGGHARTMLWPGFKKVGVGVARSAGGVWYWVLQFEE